MNQTLSLSKSITALFEGLRYTLRHRWVRTYITTAILFNILIFIVGVYLLSAVFSTLVVRIIQLAGMEQYIHGITLSEVLAFVLAVVVGIVAFPSLSSIVNAPVYNALTERMLQEQDKETPGVRKNSGRGVVGEISNAIVLEIKKLGLILSIFVLSLVLNILPVVGQILFVLLNGLQLILITGVDLFEPLIAHKRISFRQKVGNLLSHPTYWPFLLLAATISTIPVLNIVTLPIAIVSTIRVFGREVGE